MTSQSLLDFEFIFGCGFQGGVASKGVWLRKCPLAHLLFLPWKKRQLFWHILEFFPRIFWYFLFHPSPHSPQFDHLCFRSFITIRPDVFKLFPHEPHFPLFWENMQIIFIKYILLENAFDIFFEEIKNVNVILQLVLVFKINYWLSHFFNIGLITN